MGELARTDYGARMVRIAVERDGAVSVHFSDGAVRALERRGPVTLAVENDTLVWPDGGHEHGEEIYVGDAFYDAPLPLVRSGKAVPRISYFYGIAIHMYFSEEHGVPHFHARYAEYDATYAVHPTRMLVGEMPPSARRLVRRWAQEHVDELLADWERARAGEPLVEIEPLS